MYNWADTSDKDLWMGFKDGHVSAFEALYYRFYNNLERYGHRFENHEELIQESIQDLFVKLWRNKDRLSIPESPKHYLMKALRNIIYSKQQIQGRLVYKGTDADLAVLTQSQTEEMPFLATDSLSVELEYHIYRLTAKQREAIYLFYVEDFGYKEIAEFFGIRREGAYKLIYRAIDALRAEMNIKK